MRREPRMRSLLCVIFVASILLAHWQRFIDAQSNVIDPCAPGMVRPPNTWCPDSILGGNVAQSTGGIVAVSSFSSCSAVEDQRGRTLECGDTPETSQMTVLDVSLTPGSGQTVEYRANIIRTPPASGESTSVFPNGNEQCKDVEGDCSVTEEVVIEIEVSDSVVYYQLQPTQLEIPYGTAAFHTNAFGKKVTKHEKKCGPYDSTGGTATYKTKKTKSVFGSKFDRFSGGVEGFNNIIAPPMLPNLNVPYSFVISNELDTLAGSNCIEPLSNSKNALTNGISSCNPMWSGYLCSATNPNFNANDNYGMKPSNKPGSNNILLLPPSPYSRQDPFNPSDTVINLNLNEFTDDFTYEIPKAGDFGPTQQQAITNAQWLSCLRKYSPSLTNQHPGRVWAGTYFYTGIVPNKLSYYRWETFSIFKSGAVSLDDPETTFLSDIRPVCIGCGWGPFFPSTSILQPVPAKNGGEWEPGDPWPYPHPVRRPGQLVTCSADDDDCLGSATSILDSNRFRQSQPSTTTNNAAGPSVPLAVCNAVDYLELDNGYCHVDRIGAYETFQDAMPPWLRASFTVLHGLGTAVYNVQNLVGWFTDLFNIHIKDQYNTADTFGTFGEPCRVFQIQPQALPQYAIEVRMFNKDKTKLLDKVRLSNFADLSRLQESPTEGIQSATGQGTVIGAGRKLFAELTGYETVNGKIAPDLYGNIVVCNMTKDQTTIFQSDTDPTFGTPRNPWVYSNNQECGTSSDEYKRCKVMDPDYCTSSGKVPLPQCLAARPQNFSASYNPYAWWYYQDPGRASRVNEAFGSSAMPSSRFSEPNVQELVCRSPRYAGVPGWIPGFDWTREDQLRDQLNTTQIVTSITGQKYYGSNAQERAWRDKVPSHVACQVSGYFNDWQKEESCEAFLTSAAYQRYLPPNFVTTVGGRGTQSAKGPCSLPNYAVDGLNLLYFGNAQSNTQSSVRFRVGISGTLVRVESSVSSGVFNSDTSTTTCDVVRGGYGTAQLSIRNTGNLPGRYLITAKCTNGIRIVGEVIRELQPSSIFSLINVQMAHDGTTTVGNTGFCSFNLTHPDYRTQLIFSQLEQVECTLRFISSRNLNSGAGAWQQNVNFSVLCEPDENGTLNGLCKPADFVAPALETNGIAVGIVLYIAALLYIFIMMLLTCFNLMPIIYRTME